MPARRDHQFPRARSESIKRGFARTAQHRRRLALYSERDPEAPKTRGDCVDAARPCPWASCRYHLEVDMATRNGSVKLNFPGVPLERMPETCALDVADRGGAVLEDVGAAMNITRERVRQLEMLALKKFLRVWERMHGPLTMEQAAELLGDV